MKRILLLLLAAALLVLTGCRTRTTAPGVLPDAGRSAAVGLPVPGSGSQSGLGEGVESDDRTGEPGAADARTTADPTAIRREYDDQAPARIAAGADHRVHDTGEGDGRSLSAEDAAPMDQLSQDAERTATQSVPAGEADRQGTAPDAEAADTFLTYYTVLLAERTDSLFECQRRDLYWETTQDFGTVHKTSPEHQWILQAGCYDVSARLLPENLTVDAGWVQRKNPGIIVKIVDKSVLGFGVTDEGRASALYDALLHRPGWNGIDAVRHRRVVLVSEELLTSPRLRLAALVTIAAVAAPDAFADVDPAEALRSLTQEENGAPAAASLIYYIK